MPCVGARRSSSPAPLVATDQIGRLVVLRAFVP